VTWNVRLAAIVACCAIVAAPAFADTYKARHMAYRQHYIREARACPLHRNAAGNLISCDGWRLRSSSKGWDNSCLNLDYLPSQFACSNK
jgi:hypothetical protein